MRQHLQHGAGHRGLVQHQDREQHQSAVADRRVGVDVFQVGLLDCRERSVDHADTGQRQENPCQFVGRLGHQEDRHAKTTVSAEFHQHPSMQHRNGRRRRSVTVRRPRVERKHRAEHPEADERQREEQVLRAHRNRMFGDFENIHRQLTAFGRRMEIDAEDADQQQRRTSHQHQRQFHRRILFPAGSPHADQQVHRDQRHLVKHEHREQINRNEESEHPDRQQREPCEKLPRQRRHFPRSEHPGKDDHRRQQQHRHRNTVDADRIVDIQRSVPHRIGREQHFGAVPRAAFSQIHRHQRHGQAQQQRGADYHDRTDAADVLREEHRAGHQQRYQYK